MKFYFFLFFSVVAISNIVAQSSFEPAYYITQDKDTIRGFILEKTDAELARNFQFRADKNSVVKTYRPDEIPGFGFANGRVFQQIPVVITKEDTVFVFAKRIVEGKIDLFVRRYAHQSKPDIFLYNNSTNKIIPIFQPRRRVLQMDSLSLPQPEFGEKLNSEDSSFVQEILSQKKPSEKRIRKKVIKYNREFQEEYPVNIYREQLKHNYDILAGLPITTSEELHFRVGVYRNKSRVERSTNYSFMDGLVYQHRSNTNQDLTVLPEGNSIYRWHLINVIPFGVNFHGNSKVIQPYGYAGLGAGVIMAEDLVVVNGEQKENEISYQIFPTLNVGIGLKIRLGKTFLITELTPTINSLFWNVGLSL